MADKLVVKPWSPQDLIDDLQELIDEQPDMYLNHTRHVLCQARDFLKSFFAQDWVKMTDERKPKHNQLCFIRYVFPDGELYPCYGVEQWSGDGDNGYVNRPHFDNEGVHGMYVTHWKPIVPPEGEAQ